MAGQAKPLATANLSPQQQRIVLQSFKQPVATAAGASQTTTRIIRTTPAAATTSGGTATATQGGHILTLESLLQKQNAGKLIQLATSTAGGNVITLAPSGQAQQQQQQVTTTKQLPTTARIVTAGTMVPKIIGKTTVVPGKPLLLHAKTLKLGGNTGVSTQTPTATTLTSSVMKTAQNIVIGGQTVKLQGAVSTWNCNRQEASITTYTHCRPFHRAMRQAHLCRRSSWATNCCASPLAAAPA